MAAGTDREKGHVQAISLAIAGNLHGALDAVLGHVASWPRDAMVLAQALGVYGLIAFSGRKEHHA